MKLFLLIIPILFSSIAYTQKDPLASIDQILTSSVSDSSQPGLTVGVIQNDRLIYQNSIGKMNLEYDIPYNDSTVFELASVTKQFTAACIGILEKQGKLSLNDDVRKYIPELAFYSDTIRIKHLLNHTSGIRNHNVLLDLKGFDYEHQGYTNQMIQNLMFQQNGVNNAPGEKMLYSNTNYVLLALIVERISKIDLHEFAKQELFDPLKMKHTFYKNSLDEVIKNRAYPYYLSDEGYQQPKSLTLCVGAGGMFSTIQDLAIWSSIFINPEHPISYLKEFITTQDTLNNGTILAQARGMFVSPYKNYITFNHSGRDLGMRAQFICVPEKKLAIVVFSNSEDLNAVNISYKILDLFLENVNQKEKTTKKYTHSTKELKPFIGVYQELNSDLRMEIFIENDTLKAISSFGRNATALVSQTKNSLCRIDNPSICYSFQTEDNEDADLYVDFGGANFYFEKVNLTAKPNENLNEFIGDYYSKELQVTYSLRVENNKLILSYPKNENIVLTEGVKDTFGANRRTKYAFIRDNAGNITSFKVAAEGTVKDILFEKTSE